METKVVCILTLCRSSPMETASRDIFRQRAGSALCSNGHATARGSELEFGREAKLQSCRRQEDSNDGSVVLQVAAGTQQAPTKMSESLKKFSKKGFENSLAMAELFKGCPTSDTTTPPDKTDIVAGDLDDLFRSSPWISQTAEQFTVVARETELSMQEPILCRHLKCSCTESEKSRLLKGFLDEELESLETVPWCFGRAEECHSVASEAQRPREQEAVVFPNFEKSESSSQDCQGQSGRALFSDNCGVSSAELSTDWGWHLSSRVVRTKSLFSPMLYHKNHAQRLWAHRKSLATTSSASAEPAAQSASEYDTEGNDFTSSAAGVPNGNPAGISRIKKTRLSGGNGRRHPVNDPWFSKGQVASSGHLKDRASTPKFQNPTDEEDKEATEDGVARKDRGNGRETHSMWIKKAQTVVPRKQPKIDPSSFLSMQSTTGIDAAMHELVKTTSSKGVAVVMDKYASKLTFQDLKVLLTELATGPERYWTKALQVFDWMHDMAVYDIDGGMYHSMIDLLGKSKKMDIAESMIQRMKTDGLEPDNYIYTALVGGYVRSGNIQKGIAVLEQMKADGIRPPVPAYNVLIDGCVRLPRGLEVARSLMKQMKADGIAPDRVTFTTMIIVYSRKGHHGEAIRLFGDMQLQNCYPDVLTYNAVLNAYAKLGDISGMLQVHQSMFDQRVDPDTVTFNIILNALGRAGRTKDVCRFYRLMRKIGVTPDVTTCSILVNAYGKARAWDELDILIAEMERLGLQPDLTVYNSMISIYGKAARFEQVELIVKSLQQANGIVFDVITYNTLIDVYGKAGRLSDVIKWFSEMRRQEVKPDVRTFNALVHAYGRACEYEGVRVAPF